ncbi:hypothetical protein Pmani_038239 [Petrolisthes manimaculis]|uniref:Uncharacterized protein n=1 Tax=Petrolisthes manimaculis TaxID=1843537 RepID=A0AAE1TKQ7_9EUCA|nr:hypothetical protein Pmani_038239 [Petrolisthes manimaculis]
MNLITSGQRLRVRGWQCGGGAGGDGTWFSPAQPGSAPRDLAQPREPSSALRDMDESALRHLPHSLPQALT